MIIVKKKTRTSHVHTTHTHTRKSQTPKISPIIQEQWETTTNKCTCLTPLLSTQKERKQGTGQLMLLGKGMVVQRYVGISQQMNTSSEKNTSVCYMFVVPQGCTDKQNERTNERMADQVNELSAQYFLVSVLIEIITIKTLITTYRCHGTESGLCILSGNNLRMIQKSQGKVRMGGGDK